MSLLLLALIALQQVLVDAVVDRDRVNVGETVTLRITVEATGNEPVQILNPSLTGLELLGTTEQSDVSIREGVATRILTRVLRLRATNAGPGRIGPTLVRIGESTAQTDPIDMFVVAEDGASEEMLPPHVRTMVQRRIPTRLSSDAVHVEVLTSTDSVVLGEQLDLAVVAWFPQEIRSQLRTPPTLQPPELQGAWTYSHGVPHAVDMSREVRGTRYQVYVHAVVVFPLTPGPLEIGPATVSYSLPMSYSFLSREVRHEPQSDSATVFVVEQPALGRPAQFGGAAGSRLRLRAEASPPEISVGDASVVTAVLEGEGNVALWPEPRIRWPEGVRVYPEGVEVELAPDAERITGAKTFRYLVVPDSSGTHRFAEIQYPYFDLSSRRYVVLRVPDFSLVAEAASTAAGDQRRTETRLLIPSARGGVLTRLSATLPAWVWLLGVALPPILAVLALTIPRVLRRGTKASRTKDRALDRSEHEFRQILAGLVAGAERAPARELAAALRAAGVEAPIAAHAARVRERLWQAKYGPESELDPEELLAEVGEVMRALGTTVPVSHSHVSIVVTALLLVSAVAPAVLSGQSPERLYEAGAFRAAADSFEARTNQQPSAVAHWYNLGASLERMGETERARRAWIRAARLSPRDDRIRAALEQLPQLDAVSGRLVTISPVTPEEVLLGAACLWVIAWIGIAIRYRKVFSGSVMVLALICAGYGLRLRDQYGSHIAIVLTADVPLRAAPYGPAQPRQFLHQGAAVRVNRAEGVWLLVERGSGRGWLLNDEVVHLQ